MTAEQPASDLPRRRSPTQALRSTSHLLLTLQVGIFGLYVLGVVVPYLVNGLYRVPLGDVAAGGYDPKDIWPNTLLGYWSPEAANFWSISVYFTAVLGPTVSWVIAPLCGLVAGLARQLPRSTRVFLATTAAITILCLVVLVWTGAGTSFAAWISD